MKTRSTLVLLMTFPLFAYSSQREVPKAVVIEPKADDEAAKADKNLHSVHELWRTVKPFPAQVIREAAAEAKFDEKSCCPPEANDVMDYWNVVAPKPVIKKEGPIILGKVTFKRKGIKLRGENEIKPGEYVHWFGNVSGVWLGGFSAYEGAENLVYGVRFGNPPGVGPHHSDSSGHIHVLTHTPEDAVKLAALAQVPLPGGGVPKPPPPPPPPPRCLIQCRTVLDLDTKPPTEKWIPTEWIQVP